MASSQDTIDDLSLVQRVKIHKDSDSLEQLIGRHSGLYYDICQKQTCNFSGQARREILDSKEQVFYQAALKFNVTKKVKFSTWLGKYTKYYCKGYHHNSLRHLDSYNPRYKSINDETVHEQLTADPQFDFESAAEEQQRIKFLKDCLKELDNPRISFIITKRYFSEENKLVTFREIAKELKLSKQMAKVLHDQFIKFVLQKLQNQKLRKK